MSILAIETATTVCGAAVASGGVIRSIAEVDEKNVHAERLLPLIKSALEQADTTVADVDAIAVSIGPGSFTGLRIGLSVAKGLVYATGKPLIGVATLEALALNAMQGNQSKPGVAILAAIDARRDEVYCQLFNTGEGRLVPAWDVAALTVEEVLARLEGGEVMITGDAQAKIASSAKNAAFAYTNSENARCSAAMVALLGEQSFLAGLYEDAPTLEPRYIKEFFLKVR